MTSLQLLRRASGLIEKHGLSVGAGRNSSGGMCPALALVGAAYDPFGKWHVEAYIEARRMFTQSIHTAPSYQAIVDWNDSFTTSKDGTKIFKRTKKEVLAAFSRAMEAERQLVPA